MKPAKLLANWNHHPPTFGSQKMGNQFIDSMKAYVLKVLSVVLKGDCNYLINLYYKELKK